MALIKGSDSEDYLSCPRCWSKDLQIENSSLDAEVTCLKCGNKFKANETLAKETDTSDLDRELIDIIKNQGIIHAIKYYKEQTGNDLASSKKYVDSLAETENLKPTSKGGCAGVILLFVILSGAFITYI